MKKLLNISFFALIMSMASPLWAVDGTKLDVSYENALDEIEKAGTNFDAAASAAGQFTTATNERINNYLKELNNNANAETILQNFSNEANEFFNKFINNERDKKLSLLNETIIRTLPLTGNKKTLSLLAKAYTDIMNNAAISGDIKEEITNLIAKFFKLYIIRTIIHSIKNDEKLLKVASVNSELDNILATLGDNTLLTQTINDQEDYLLNKTENLFTKIQKLINFDKSDDFYKYLNAIEKPGKIWGTTKITGVPDYLTLLKNYLYFTDILPNNESLKEFLKTTYNALFEKIKNTKALTDINISAGGWLNNPLIQEVSPMILPPPAPAEEAAETLSLADARKYLTTLETELSALTMRVPSE